MDKSIVSYIKLPVAPTLLTEHRSAMANAAKNTEKHTGGMMCVEKCVQDCMLAMAYAAVSTRDQISETAVLWGKTVFCTDGMMVVVYDHHTHFRMMVTDHDRHGHPLYDGRRS